MFVLRCTLELLMLAVIGLGPLPLWLHHALDHQHSVGVCRTSEAHHCHDHLADCDGQESESSWSSDSEHCAACYQLAQATLVATLASVNEPPQLQPELRPSSHSLFLATELGSHPPRGPPTA
jgi:hypothetical protein